MVSFSIVSHGHSKYLTKLILSIKAACHGKYDYEILLRINSRPLEDDSVLSNLENMEHVQIFNNKSAKGFATNNNLNFKNSKFPYFFVINPDCVLSNISIYQFQGIQIPKVLQTDGKPAINGRAFPTLLRLFSTRRYSKVEWYGGMALLIDKNVYSQLNGFNEAYFMYVEDCDLFYRAQLQEIKIRINDNTVVNHVGQHESRRKLKLFYHHLYSLIRFNYVYYKNKITSFVTG